jgi:RNA polymerase sigma factor (sigma-70 family)
MPALAPRDAPPAFTPRQRHVIRKIARRFGYPHDLRWDFVHETWLKVHDGWKRVPRVEPGMSRYIFRIARNLAIDLFRRFEEDAMTGAVVFSSLPEGAEQDEEEPPDEDAPGTPEIVHFTIEDRVLARQLWARAQQRDREAADWLARNEIDEEAVREIEADVGQPADRIYKRMSRLVERLEADARYDPERTQVIEKTTVPK